MRTSATKELERLNFEKLSTASILIGAGKEIYKRYDAEMWAFLAFAELAVIVWIKLGK